METAGRQAIEISTKSYQQVYVTRLSTAWQLCRQLGTNPGVVSTVRQGD
jgi:hypothetical protein